MLLLLIFLLALPSVAAATTYANFNRSAYGYTSTLTPSQEANRYQVLVLQSSDAAIVPTLKAANPNLKILMYEGIQAAAERHHGVGDLYGRSVGAGQSPQLDPDRPER